MTTPEAFRRRQRIEGTALIVLGVFTILISLYFRGQDAAQQRCFSAFIAADNTTSAIRSRLVEQESAATRRIISGALTAQTREDIIAARESYFLSLKRIDKARAANPVRQFSPGECS